MGLRTPGDDGVDWGLKEGSANELNFNVKEHKSIVGSECSVVDVSFLCPLQW